MNLPSVAELLAEPILSDVSVLAGAAGLEREVADVRWWTGEPASVQDHLVVCGPEPVTPPYRLDALVRRTGDAGAAGLLVVGASVRPLLSSVRLADRLEIPVLWLENADPVVLVQELTPRVRASELVRARVVERLLRQLAPRRTGQDIVAAAEAVLEAPLALVTSDGTNLIGTPMELDETLHLDRPVVQRGRGVLVHPVLDPDGNRPAAWLACRVERAAESRVGVLAAGLATTEPFLRSWLTAQRAHADRDLLFRARLLSEVLAGRDSVSRDVVEGAVSVGWQLSDWHVGLHASCDVRTGSDQQAAVPARLHAALVEHGIALTEAVDRGDGWALWSSTEVEPGTADARALLRAVRLVTAALPREWGLVVGIGRAHRGPGGLAETLAEARDAAHLASSHDFRPAVEHSDELGVARLLATWQQSEVTRAFAETALAPLRSSESLLATLRAYLESGGSVVLVAEALGVHRNTVTARLQQVRDRLGVDLDDPSQRLALQVACRSIGA
ncbi:helix-turn-helix domain-containing protein [Nocardioides sp. NPDC057772]|uniref:helix-turn-helix domain-containing protein n=1 Tax=Nocardioides sp. NPDC057772 TaxID=3346245 RepID=UPI00366C42F5